MTGSQTGSRQAARRVESAPRVRRGLTVLVVLAATVLPATVYLRRTRRRSGPDRARHRRRRAPRGGLRGNASRAHCRRRRPSARAGRSPRDRQRPPAAGLV